MNEQNNSLNNTQNPQQPVPVQPTPQPDVVAQPVEAANPAPQPPVAPATQTVETPVVPTPAPAPAPTPVDVQPVTPELPAVAPVASPAPVTAPVDASQGTMPQAVPSFEGVPVTTPSVAPVNNPVPTPNGGNAGFVPGTVTEKKSKKGLIAVIVVAVIAVLGALGYFVIYPLVLKSLVTPEKVYTNTINAVFKEITTTVEEVIHEKATYSIDLSVDSNMPTISSFSGYTYEVNIGADPTTEAFQAGITMKNSTVNYGAWGYFKDGKKYTRYSTDNVLNYIGDVTEAESNELFDTFKQMLDAQDGADTEKINYVINKVNELVVSSIDENKLTQEETTIKVGGTDVKVLNNKYVMDEATLEATAKHVLNGLKEDKTVIKNLAELLDYSEDEVKEMLTYEEPEEDEEEDEEEESPLVVNIYVTNKGALVGFAFTDDKGNVDFHYYENNGSFELELYEKSVDEETNKESENRASIVGVPKSGKTNVTVTYNKETIATLVIKKNTETELDLDYEIIMEEDQKINGTLALTNNNDDKKMKSTLKFTMKAAEQYLNIDLGTTIDWTTEVAKINTGNAVTVTEEEHNNKKTAFREQVNNTPIGLFFQTTSGNMSGGINDYYEDEYYDDDYYEITDEENDVIFEDTTDEENDVIFEDTTDEDSVVYID